MARELARITQTGALVVVAERRAQFSSVFYLSDLEDEDADAQMFSLPNRMLEPV